MDHIGTNPIQTKRLLLRRIRHTDCGDIYKMCSNPNVNKYLSYPIHKSIDDSISICNTWAAEYKEDINYNWAIVYNDRVIGNISVIVIVNTTAVIGWQLAEEHWNKGFMTEAATAVFNYLFNRVGFEKIETRFVEPNIGSGRVMEKIGMKFVDLSDTDCYSIKNEPMSHGFKAIHMQITRNEYNNIYNKGGEE